MDGNARQPWDQFLNPDILRANLIQASVYIAAFEILEDAIVERIYDFYVVGYRKAGISGIVSDTQYNCEVLNLNKSPIYASLQWLKNAEAIVDSDILMFTRVKQCRNKIAHEMDHILDMGLPPEFADCFGEIVLLLDKIERWWIINVEIPTSPDTVTEDINDEDVTPGGVLLVRVLLDIALGSEDASRYYYDRLKHPSRT